MPILARKVPLSKRLLRKELIFQVALVLSLLWFCYVSLDSKPAKTEKIFYE